MWNIACGVCVPIPILPELPSKYNDVNIGTFVPYVLLILLVLYFNAKYPLPNSNAVGLVANASCDDWYSDILDPVWLTAYAKKAAIDDCNRPKVVTDWFVL